MDIADNKQGHLFTLYRRKCLGCAHDLPVQRPRLRTIPNDARHDAKTTLRGLKERSQIVKSEDSGVARWFSNEMWWNNCLLNTRVTAKSGCQ